MEQPRLKVETVPTSALIPYANNAKIHTDKQVEEIAASIEQFGFSDPVGVWTRPDGQLEIVEGHGRVMAAERLGIERVPIIRLDHLDDDARRAYSHVHNQTTLTSGFDWDILNADMAGLPDFDWESFGFRPQDIRSAFEPESVTEDDLPEDAPPRAKRGDVFLCGEHRVMCGDATSAPDLDRLMDGWLADFVFTDPPYGVAIGDKNAAINAVEPGRGGRIEENIAGDTLGTDELYAMLVRAFTNLREHCAPDCSYYVSSPQGGELGLMMMMMMRDAGLPVRHNLIWVKSSACFSMGRLDYDYKHEPIFYTWTKSHNFYGGYETTVVDDDKPLEKLSKAELKDMVHALQEARETTVVYCDKPMRNDLHPTMKPIKLVARFMHNSSKRGDTVADVFGGSGSTLIAAEQLGRKARIMELDPHYVDVIVKRWEDFTGKTATLEQRAGTR